MITEIRKLAFRLDHYANLDFWTAVPYVWQDLLEKLETENKCTAVEKLLNIYNISFGSNLASILMYPDEFFGIIDDAHNRYPYYHLKIGYSFRSDPYFQYNPWVYLVNRLWLTPKNNKLVYPRHWVFTWFTAEDKGLEEIYKQVTEIYPNQDHF
ncbi:hypothetical protein, partial [Moorena sp. SIO2C4]|uniref:hypothetical protein n=1 Tax=Moorena sp. SIO2C4 TaxID=2607824 RepID=UPI0013CB2494